MALKNHRLAPKPKVAAGAGAGAAYTAVAVILAWAGVDVPGPVIAAVGTLVSFVAAYFKSE